MKKFYNQQQPAPSSSSQQPMGGGPGGASGGMGGPGMISSKQYWWETWLTLLANQKSPFDEIWPLMIIVVDGNLYNLYFKYV